MVSHVACLDHCAIYDLCFCFQVALFSEVVLTAFAGLSPDTIFVGPLQVIWARAGAWRGGAQAYSQQWLILIVLQHLLIHDLFSIFVIFENILVQSVCTDLVLAV